MLKKVAFTMYPVADVARGLTPGSVGTRVTTTGWNTTRPAAAASP